MLALGLIMQCSYGHSSSGQRYLQGAPIKNNPLEKMLYFSHDSTDLSQTFRLYMGVFTQHILQILLK